MERAAPLTCLVVLFVQAGYRRFESQAGLAYLGVPLQRQVYLGLCDGRLVAAQPSLDDMLANVIDDFRPDRLFTTGADGYDGHTDHIEMRDSALRVVKRLGMYGVACYALDSQHRGELVIANSSRKLGAMALHSSQRVHDDLTRWGDTKLYTPLIIGAETYTLVS
jgi:LmbE family N-acetylglucosaminyl deacetylase